MDKIKFGENVVLEDGREYSCFSTLEENGNEYVFLVSNFKPVEVRFAKQTIINGQIDLEMIFDQELKTHLYKLFKSKTGNILKG